MENRISPLMAGSFDPCLIGRFYKRENISFQESPFFFFCKRIKWRRLNRTSLPLSSSGSVDLWLTNLRHGFVITTVFSFSVLATRLHKGSLKLKNYWYPQVLYKRCERSGYYILQQDQYQVQRIRDDDRNVYNFETTIACTTYMPLTYSWKHKKDKKDFAFIV